MIYLIVAGDLLASSAFQQIWTIQSDLCYLGTANSCNNFENQAAQMAQELRSSKIRVRASGCLTFFPRLADRELFGRANAAEEFTVLLGP